MKPHLSGGARKVAALAVVLLAAFVTPVAAAPVAIGLHAERNGDQTLSQAELARMRSAGTDAVRTTFDWELVQREPNGAFDFTNFDRVMLWASEGSLPAIEVAPILIGTPDWVASSGSNTEPPTGSADLNRWAAFVRAAVARYGNNGGFWRERQALLDSGELRYNPITAWQVWNEPNLKTFWTDGDPNAREYVRFLASTSRSIKSTDPGARVVLGGMPEGTKRQYPAAEFLAQMYKVRNFRTYFDAIAVHPFVPVDEKNGLQRATTLVRKVADRNGDKRVPLWLTELGASSAGPRSPFTTSEQGQRKVLVNLFGQIQANARKLGIEKVFWHKWRDTDSDPPRFASNDRWQTYTGLFTLNGRPKPAWSAFAQAAGGQAGTVALP